MSCTSSRTANGAPWRRSVTPRSSRPCPKSSTRRWSLCSRRARRLPDRNAEGRNRPTTHSRGPVMIKLYHAEPGANSLKALLSFKEKGLEFESIYVDLHKFEQHEPWFVAINPEGQVPVLVHDGVTITHTTVIGEYLEDAFPDAPPLRPADPV